MSNYKVLAVGVAVVLIGLANHCALSKGEALKDRLQGGTNNEYEAYYEQIPTPEVAQTNCLVNDSFEELDGNGNPAHWFRASRPDLAIDLKMEIDKTCAHTGTSSVKISCAGLKQSVCNNWEQEIKNFPKGCHLRLVGWIKTEKQEGITSICIQGWDRNQRNQIALVSTQGQYAFEGTKDWTQVQAEIFAPKNTEMICVRLVLTGKGTVWFDDISLMPVFSAQGKQNSSYTNFSYEHGH